jgi:predicted ATPase
MAHLEHVSVEGFKKIEQLSLDVGQFTVVTGRNNSGKSSLLEAAAVATTPSQIDDVIEVRPATINRESDAASVSVGTEDSEWEVRLEVPSEEQAFRHLVEMSEPILKRRLVSKFSESAVSDESVRRTVEENLHESLLDAVEATGVTLSRGIVEIHLDNQVYPQATGGADIRSIITYSYKDLREKISEPQSDTPDSSRIKLVSLLLDGDLGGDIGETKLKTSFFNLPQKIWNSNFSDEIDVIKTDEIGDFLREKQIVDNLKTFTLDSLVFEPDDGEKYSVPFDQMGEGFRAIVGLLWELLDDDLPEVVFLEEPSTHMHPGYVRELVYFLVDLAREEDVQLFLTTHDSDLLNDLFTDNLTQEEVSFLESEFRLVQMQDGTADVMEYREAEHTLEELMLDLRGI